MSMNFERDELFRLFGGLSHGTLSEADHERLQQALRESAEARRQWFLFNDLESGLAVVTVARAVTKPALPSRRWGWAAVAGAAALIVALVAILPHKTPEPVAVLSAATNARWSDPNVELMLRGGELPAGPLQLEAGFAELAFASGATAVIEGPAVFEPMAADRLMLRSGRAIGRCEKPNSELVIITPDAEVIDLGTEFGVAVGDERQTRVAVIKGAVELVAGKTPRRLEAGEAIAVDAHGLTREAQSTIGEFSRIAMILPAEERHARDGVNRLKDASFTDLAQAWKWTAGHVEKDGSGAVRICAKGSPLWPLLWQTAASGDIGGRVVIASVRAMQPADDPLSGRQNAIVKIVFLDASGREFASAERHFLRAMAPRNQWIRGQIAARAPLGTVAVRFQVLLNARGSKTGALCFTDASLIVVPE